MSRPSDGAVRQSQIVTTFGPGAMLDLPKHSVIVGGLEWWMFPNNARKTITEPRLEEEVCRVLGLARISLVAPPIRSDDLRPVMTGVKSFQFPAWFLAQVDHEHLDPATGRKYRSRPLVPLGQVSRGVWRDDDKKPHDVVPVRFVQACVRGHISDINWYAFVYRDWKAPRKGTLWLDEGGAGGDFADIYVRCEITGARRPLADARLPESRALGRCDGRRPWLGSDIERGCEQHARLLVRSASNAYFPQQVGVISIPDAEEAVRVAVAPIYEAYLQYCEGEADVARERKKQPVAVQLAGFTDAVVWAHIEGRKNPRPKQRGLKLPEITTLLSQPDSVGEDKPDGDFYARTRPARPSPPWLDGKLDRVVLVHRLREVVAQVGFTRFEAREPSIDGALDVGVERGALAHELSWVPAVENRGEGVLLTFRPAAITAWLKRVQDEGQRSAELSAGFDAWAQKKQVPLFGGAAAAPELLTYVMLHSLSHLLITAVSLECGYAASSIRERIYTGTGGHGILLYTASPGAEGTLGGLVQVGTRIERYLASALERGRLCSNDPVCAYHRPDDPNEERYLHGAACHGCLLTAETSCERRNDFLDRALVVPTVHTRGVAFFEQVP